MIVNEIDQESWIGHTDEGTPLNNSTPQDSNLRLVFAAFSDFSELVHQTIMLLYSDEQPLNGNDIVAIYLKYLQWYDTLPDQLRLGSNSTPVVLFTQ